MARPKLKIDPQQVEELASISCSYEEIAAVSGCSVSLLHKRFSTVIQKGRDRGRESLRRAQFKSALNGNATMLIWLGKQHLGQADKTETTNTIRAEEAVETVREHLQRNRTESGQEPG